MRIGRLWPALALIFLCGGPGELATAQQGRLNLPTRFDITFNDSCDGMNLWLYNRGSVTGQHTGCNAGELLIGQQFTTGDETGVTITFYEHASSNFVRYDIYQTGFRAGRFYVYQPFTGVLLRYSTYTVVP